MADNPKQRQRDEKSAKLRKAHEKKLEGIEYSRKVASGEIEHEPKKWKAQKQRETKAKNLQAKREQWQKEKEERRAAGTPGATVVERTGCSDGGCDLGRRACNLFGRCDKWRAS